MGGADYLEGLPPAQAERLTRVNKPGLTALRGYLASGDAVAFLGAGMSRPLYPLWTELIGELVASASGRLTDEEAATCLMLARESPEEVVEIVRRSLGPGAYREVLRQVLRVRTNPETGRSWTPVQELICRCAFKAVMPSPGPQTGVAVRWVPGPDPVEHFTGRAEELARVDRWAADPQVALVGVTAWGGAGKTALVTRWVEAMGGTTRRAGVRGVFGWSFYADPSAEHWAQSLLEWAQQDLGIEVAGIGRLAEAVLGLLRAEPLLLVLELDALGAQALLDHAEGIDRLWAAKANALHTRLVPPGLDPDPLATVERLVAADRKESES